MSITCVGKGIYLVCLCAWEGGRSEQEESKWDEAGSCHGLEQGKIRLVFKEAQTTAMRTGWKWESRLHHCLGRAGWGLPAAGWGGEAWSQWLDRGSTNRAGEVGWVDGERCGDKWHLIIVLLPTTNTLCTLPVHIQHVTKFSQQPRRQAWLSSPYPQ